MIYKANASVHKKLFSVFADMDDTFILSCLQGHMGQAWVDDLIHPKAAQITVGDFSIFAGHVNAVGADELLRNLPNRCLVILQHDAWKRRLEKIYPISTQRIERFAFRKNAADLVKKHLQSLVDKLPQGYEVQRIDYNIAAMPSLQEISSDFTGQFESLDDYVQRGIGYCVMHQGDVVSAASSYSVFDMGIEIEVGTDPGYRRKGLAAVAAAALILDCLQQGIYPSWDAANTESAGLAEKLGYVMKGAYDTYDVKTDC